MPLSTDLDNAIINHITKKALWAQPAATFIGLSTTTPNKDGTNVTEPGAGVGYARQQVTTAQWDAAAASKSQTNVVVTIGTATADWLAGANFTHVVIYDQAAGGNFLAFKALAVPKPILNQDTAKFNIADISITVSGTA